MTVSTIASAKLKFGRLPNVSLDGRISIFPLYPFGVGAGVKYELILLVFFTLFLFHIHIQPLRGWGHPPALSPGCTWGYSHFQAKVSLRETLA